MSRENERKDVERRLRNARVRLKRAKSDVEDLEGQLAVLDEEDALDLIKSWRGVPDWSALLRSETAIHLYMLKSFFLEKMGLSHRGKWTDIDQTVVSVGVADPKEPEAAVSYVSRIAAAIETVLPHFVIHDDGLAWFNVHGRGIEGFALELRVAPDLSVVKILRLVYQRVKEEMVFDGLNDALFHLQGKHPASDAFEDPSDPAHAPGQSGQALREALSAFLEGCRSAGAPVDLAGADVLIAAAGPADIAA